jgi:hypothetical protein
VSSTWCRGEAWGQYLERRVAGLLGFRTAKADIWLRGRIFSQLSSVSLDVQGSDAAMKFRLYRDRVCCARYFRCILVAASFPRYVVPHALHNRG